MNIRFSTILLLVICGLTTSFIHAESELVRDIILINGIAELVDVTMEGEIVQRHVVIEDYFSSGRSHKRSLRESLNKLKVFGAAETVEENSVVYTHPVDCRQSLMMTHLKKDTDVQSETSRPGEYQVNSKFHHDSFKSSLNRILEMQEMITGLNIEASIRQHSSVSNRCYDIERDVVTSIKTSEASNDV